MAKTDSFYLQALDKGRGLGGVTTIVTVLPPYVLCMSIMLRNANFLYIVHAGSC